MVVSLGTEAAFLATFIPYSWALHNFHFNLTLFYFIPILSSSLSLSFIFIFIPLFLILTLQLAYPHSFNYVTLSFIVVRSPAEPLHSSTKLISTTFNQLNSFHDPPVKLKNFFTLVDTIKPFYWINIFFFVIRSTQLICLF